MVCCDDPEGAEVLRCYYNQNTPLERIHFIDRVINKKMDEVNKSKRYVDSTWEESKLIIIKNLRDEFIKNGDASDLEYFIGIHSDEVEIMRLD